MFYHLITLGCQMNIADSERIHAIIKSMGYIETENEEEANLLGILACSVRQKAIDKVYSRIHKWNKWKNTRSLITFVSGCVLPADKEKFLKQFDILFPVSEAESLPQLIREYGVVSPQALQEKIGIPDNKNIFSLWNLKAAYRSDFEAFVPIQNGCDKFCTFCAVPYTRGREVSRPSEDILREVKALIDTGYKTITLLGQNVNSYGNDKEDELSFAQLLEKIGVMGQKSKREFWVYFTSPHPRDMRNEVIDAVSKYKCLAKQIHLPMQSGDDKVLTKMNRKHDMERYMGIINYIRKKIPEATIFTDIIVGFTGESREQFMNSVKALEEIEFNMAYVAMYSPRPGAAAYRWEDNIEKQEKKYRLHYISEKLAVASRKYTESMIGKTYRVLVTGTDRKAGYLSGLTEGKINVRFASTQTSLIGSFIEIKITSASDFSAEGELAEIQLNSIAI